MSLRSLTVTAPLLESDVLNWVVEDDFCKIQEILAAGSGADNKVDMGTVLGRIVAATVVVAAAVFAGTGNGVLTKATPAFGVGVQNGTYKVQLIDEGTNVGDFLVIRPDGTIDGIASVGVAYVGQIKFTIADGATDFTSPAVFTLAVTVTAVTSKVVPLNLAGTDGSQNASAVSISKRTATDGGSDQPIVTIKRGPAIVREQGLIWPVGATVDQIATGIAQLEALGIIVHAS